MTCRLGAAVVLLLILSAQWTASALTVSTDHKAYFERDTVTVAAEDANGTVTFQVVWRNTTVVLESVDVNGTDASIEFTVPNGTAGRHTVYVVSMNESTRTSYIVAPMTREEAGPTAEIILIILIILFGIFCGSVGGMWKFELTRLMMLGAMMPLISRRAGNKPVLTRGKILGVVLSEPGIHYGGIRSRLNLPNGTTAYHLHILEREEEVISVRDGTYRRYYPKSHEVMIERSVMGLTKSQIKVLNMVEEHPGLSQKEFGSMMGWSQQRISYHLGNLAEKGYIQEDHRKVKRYFVQGTPVRFTCPKCHNQFTSDKVPKLCPYCEYRFDEDFLDWPNSRSEM